MAWTNDNLDRDRYKNPPAPPGEDKPPSEDAGETLTMGITVEFYQRIRHAAERAKHLGRVGPGHELLDYLLEEFERPLPEGYYVVMTCLPGPNSEFVEAVDHLGNGVGENLGLTWWVIKPSEAAALPHLMPHFALGPFGKPQEWS